MLSPRPLLPSAVADAQLFLTVAEDAIRRGDAALEAADSASPPGDLASPGNATEASIGAAASLSQALMQKALLQPLVLTTVVDTALPFVLKAQRLESPDLQGLILQLRAMVPSLKCVLPGRQHAPRFLAALQVTAADPAWQVRASALAALQALWFRCVAVALICCTRLQCPWCVEH